MTEGNPIPRRPSRHTSFPSLGGTACAPVFAPRCREHATIRPGIPSLGPPTASVSGDDEASRVPGDPAARMPRSQTPTRLTPSRSLDDLSTAFRQTHGVGSREYADFGAHDTAYTLPVSASQPGSPQDHASLGSGW